MGGYAGTHKKQDEMRHGILKENFTARRK